MCYYCQSCLADSRIFFMEVLIEVFVIGLDYVWKSVEEISHRYYYVVLCYGADRRVVEKLGYVWEFGGAERGAEA